MINSQSAAVSIIRLRHTLPLVFRGERIPKSQVWECDLELKRGCRVLVEAASGTGKSSLCAYLYGTRNDYEGTILFDDADISSLTVEQWQSLRRTSLAYLPQELALFPELTALENIMLKNDLTQAVEAKRINAWLRELGIESRAGSQVGRMSVGQQQRVAIIRSLCQPFDFILLDEPVSHLDDANNAIVARIVLERAEELGAGIIATSVGNRIAIPGLTSLML